MRAKIITCIFATITIAIAWLSAFAQVGPPNTIQCNALSTTQPTAPATLTTIIPGVNNKVTVICGWHVTSSSGTPGTFSFSQGTGTNCATTNTALTPTENITSNAPSADHIDYAALSAPSGNNICATISATAISVGVWYAQF